MTEKNAQALETGLSAEYKEGEIEGRDPVREIKEDLEIYDFITDEFQKQVDELRASREKLKLSEDDLDMIEALNLYLADTKILLGRIKSEGELFATTPDKEAGAKSVKLVDMETAKARIAKLFGYVAAFSNLESHVTKKFGTAKSWFEALSKKTSQHYDRYMSDRVREKEGSLQKLTGTETALFNSGMSAIDTVLRHEELKSGDVILVGQNFYGQTGEILKDYEKAGVNVVRVDTGDAGAVIKALQENKPRMLMLETIANATSMEVADLDALMAAVHDMDTVEGKSTRMIIDNTFLTPKMSDVIERSRKYWGKEKSSVVAVESATKYYQWGFDNVNAGVVYSDDKEYVDKLRGTRAKIGTNMPGRLATFLPEIDPVLWERKLRRHSDNAVLLAGKLETHDDKINVSYPGLESHRDHATLAREYKSAGGLIFLTMKEGVNGEDIVDKARTEARKAGVNINIGGSFGHPETWAVAVNKGTLEKPKWMVRVAVGSEHIGDFKKVMNAFEKALE